MTAAIPVMPVFGTRPEGVKMAPIIRALGDDPRFRCDVVITGQHREMLDQINEGFGIAPAVDLDLFRPGQSITTLAARTLRRLEPVLQKRAPRAVLVQGDTTSALAAGLAAFYAGVPVVHVEAGLRTPSLASPFPEEGNRRLLSRITSLHLAATQGNRATLIAEGVDASDIAVTGNPVIDAVLAAVGIPAEFTDPRVASAVDSSRSVVLVTAHRRESWGAPMGRVANALHSIATQFPDVVLIFPMHPNPLVRDQFVPVLGALPNVVLTEPLGYFELARVLTRCRLVLTDSGGIQEEAPALGVPVVVLRDETERIEGVVAGTAELVGTDPDRIVSAAERLMAIDGVEAAALRHRNPYGDGQAAERTVAALAAFFELGERLPDFARQGAPL